MSTPNLPNTVSSTGIFITNLLTRYRAPLFTYLQIYNVYIHVNENCCYQIRLYCNTWNAPGAKQNSTRLHRSYMLILGREEVVDARGAMAHENTVGCSMPGRVTEGYDKSTYGHKSNETRQKQVCRLQGIIDHALEQCCVVEYFALPKGQRS